MLKQGFKIHTILYYYKHLKVGILLPKLSLSDSEFKIKLFLLIAGIYFKHLLLCTKLFPQVNTFNFYIFSTKTGKVSNHVSFLTRIMFYVQAHISSIVKFILILTHIFLPVKAYILVLKI